MERLKSSPTVLEKVPKSNELVYTVYAKLKGFFWPCVQQGSALVFKQKLMSMSCTLLPLHTVLLLHSQESEASALISYLITPLAGR